MVRLSILSALVGLLLSGCSMAPYYSQLKAVADTGVATAIEDRKEFNDKKLALSLVTVCDSSVGAVYRLTSAELRDIVIRLCGGEQSLTAGELTQLLKLFNPTTGAIELPVAPDTPLVEPN